MISSALRRLPHPQPGPPPDTRTVTPWAPDNAKLAITAKKQTHPNGGKQHASVVTTGQTSTSGSQGDGAGSTAAGPRSLPSLSLPGGEDPGSPPRHHHRVQALTFCGWDLYASYMSQGPLQRRLLQRTPPLCFCLFGQQAVLHFQTQAQDDQVLSAEPRCIHPAMICVGAC